MIRKKYYLGFLLLTMLSNAFLLHNVGAQNSTVTIVSSEGNIKYNPALSTAASNLAVIPDDWLIGSPFTYVSEDSKVKRSSSNSIRIDADPLNTRDRGAFLKKWGINCVSGDHVVFKCWIKAASGSGYDGNAHYGGGRIGIDLYVREEETGNIFSLVWKYTDPYVPYDSDWTSVVMDETVPSSPYTGYAYVEKRTVTGTIVSVSPWLQAMPETVGPSVWFADTEMYINP